MIAAPLLAASALTLPSCNLARARAQIKSSQLTIPASQSISRETFRVDPRQADQVVCIRFPRDKVVLMAVTIASGFGTAGIVDWVVFVGGANGYKVSLIRGGYRLGLARVGSDIVETEPVYGAKDPSCCPTGGFDHTRWRWDGARLRVVRSWHDTSFKPYP